MLTSATRGETLTPNPNKCNSTLTSGTNNIYPYPYINDDVNDQGHCFRSGPPLTNYPHAAPYATLIALAAFLKELNVVGSMSSEEINNVLLSCIGLKPNLAFN